jgi:hypothetical protein
MRRYGEVVEVSRESAAAGPERFVWRGRLYVVRAVLAHWVEVGAWWLQRDREGLPTRSDAASRHVWRVAAQSGRSGGEGVYDLAYDESEEAWRLARTLD